MSGRSITKSSKRCRATLDVLTPAARTATRYVLESHGADGLWVLLAELGVDGPSAILGGLVIDEKYPVTYQYEGKSWILCIEDVPVIEKWIKRRALFIGHGSHKGSRELADWLRGPVSTEVRRILKPMPYRSHISIGIRVLNAISREDLVQLTGGSEPLLWELTGRIGVTADEFEPHSTSRIHQILDLAAEEIAQNLKVSSGLP